MSDIFLRPSTVQANQSTNVAQLERNRQQQIALAEQEKQKVIQTEQAEQEYIAKQKAATEAQAKFERENVKLKSGEWIDRASYDKLSKADQSRIDTLGIKGFNDYLAEEQRIFQSKNIQLKSGDWIDKESYNKLPASWQDKLNNLGTQGYNNWLKTAYGGATEYFIVPNYYGRNVIFGKTANPNIGIDESGNREWLGDRWPASVRTYIGVKGEPIPSLQPYMPPKSPIDTSGIYAGLPTAQGGTWGKTPETLAVAVAAGDTRESIMKAIDKLTPTEKARFDNETFAIQSAAGEDIQQKLDNRAAERAGEYSLSMSSPEKDLNVKVIPLADGQSVSREVYDSLTKSEQSQLMTKGLSSVFLTTDKGELVNKEWVNNNLNKEQKNLLLKEGFDAFKEKLDVDFKQSNVQLKSGEWISKVDFESLPQPMQQEAMVNGLSAIDLGKLPPNERFEKMQKFGMIPMNSEFTGLDNEGNVTYRLDTGEKGKQLSDDDLSWWDSTYNTGDQMIQGILKLPEVLGDEKSRTVLWEGMTPWDESKGEGVTLAGAGKMVAENLTPLVYAIGNWDKLSKGEKTIALATDALSLGLFFIPGIRGVSTAIRMGSSLPRAIGTTAGRLALQEIKSAGGLLSPIQALLHPIESGKSVFRLGKEIFGGRTVPYEVTSRGLATGKGIAKSYGSDLKWTVGGGNEMPGAALEGVGELVKAGQAGTKAEALIGTKFVKLSPTGFEEIAGRSLQTHSSPSVEKFLEEIASTGAITTKNPKEAAIFSSVGGTEFWRQGAFGGSGQIPGGLHTEGAISNLPKEIAELRDPVKMEVAFVEAAKSGKLKGKAFVGSKQYKGWDEFESLTPEGTKQVPVYRDEYKTFKWRDPEPILVEKSKQLLLKAQESEQLATKAKTVQEAEQHMKLVDQYAKESVDVYKEAVKKGTPKEFKTNIDYIETIDPLTGQNLLYLHTVLEGQENIAKPWTKSQIAQWKFKGFMNIPRDIFVPALSAPKISPEKQIQLALNRFNIAEKERFLAGLDLLGILNKEKPAKAIIKGLKLSDIEMIPKQSVVELEKWFAKNDHRIYGSSVEWSQARTSTMKPPGDLDFAVNNPEKAVKELASIINKTSKDKVIVAKGSFGEMWAIKRVKDGEKVLEADSMISHIGNSNLPFGLEAARKSVKVGNFKMEQLSEQFHRRGSSLLFPGFGVEGTKLQPTELAKMAELGIKGTTTEGRAGFGVIAAGKWSRLKDIGKFRTAAEGLIDGMRQDAKGLPHGVKELKLVEADRAEKLLNRFIEQPSVDDMSKLGLKSTATLDDYYDALGNNFTKEVESVSSISPKELARQGKINSYISDRVKSKGITQSMARFEAEARFGKIVASPSKISRVISDDRALGELINNKGISRITNSTLERVPISVDISVERIPNRVSTRLDRTTTRIGRVERVSQRAGITPERISRIGERIPSRIGRVTDRIPDRTNRIPSRIPDRVPSRVPSTETPRIHSRVRPLGRTTPIIPAKFRIPPPRKTTGGNTLKSYGLGKKKMESAIAWKQGFIYKLWYQPYGQKDVINTRKPIPGVIYYEGAGSAAKSLISKFGDIPPHIKRDMGVVDINVFRTSNEHKPRIEFKPDVKQKTKFTGVVRKPVKQKVVKRDTMTIRKVSDGMFL